MKKTLRYFFAFSLALGLSLAAFGGCDPAQPEKPEDPDKQHTQHVDADNDGKCDVCDEPVGTVKPEPEDPDKQHTQHVDEDNDGKCDVCNEPVGTVTPEPEKPFAVTYRAGYTPERFSDVTNEVTKLSDGVYLVANHLTLNYKGLSQESVVYTIEIDLNKAGIAAGTKDNRSFDSDFGHATPYAMAQAWEKATGGQVYASLNADFFNQNDPNGKCVNAFVKDGVIIKDSHNDNGNYDYKSDKSDVPASAPMLFGVKGTTAQIAPIQAYTGDVTTSAVKEQLIKAKLGYGIQNGDVFYTITNNVTPTQSQLAWVTEGEKTLMSGVALKLDTTKGVAEMKVLEAQPVSKRTSFKAGEGYGWLLAMRTNSAYSYLAGKKAGDTFSFSVMSPDGAWNGYETILGCRQALVIDDARARTVELENTNGAQTRDIPRSAVGIKDGKVVIFAVESMYYYNKAKDGDTHGMNLPELAEFAYFYGCTQAANFDGGGSTQLVVRGEGEETAKVVIRSADTAGTGLNDTRPVMNAILVTSKQEN